MKTTFWDKINFTFNRYFYKLFILAQNVSMDFLVFRQPDSETKLYNFFSLCTTFLTFFISFLKYFC